MHLKVNEGRKKAMRDRIRNKEASFEDGAEWLHSDVLDILSDHDALLAEVDRLDQLCEQTGNRLISARTLVEQADKEIERLRKAMWSAVEASDNDGGSASDAIQDMLAVLEDALTEKERP